MAPQYGNAALPGKTPLSISFSASGYLAVYQLGVVQCLLNVAPGVVEGAPKVFGTSAGALAAAAVVCGANMGHIREEMIEFAQAIRGRLLGPLNPSADVFSAMERVLRRIIPENAHQLASGRLHIAVTRIPDGKEVFISEFQSREDVIQALLCSCFLPMYCGLMPPSFKGNHYIDGGFASIQPAHDLYSTLTVSPFAGEADICPHDQLEDHYDLVVHGLAFQMTIFNFYRMMNALVPPTCNVLQKAYNSGYQDAHFFLQRSDILEYQPSLMNGLSSSAKECSGSMMESHIQREDEEEKEREEEEEEKEEEEEEEEVQETVQEEEEVEEEEREVLEEETLEYCSDGPESLTWSLSSLELLLYLSLPTWVQAALLCNLMAQIGLVGYHDSVPARLISYLLLPYTLPTCIFFDFTLRLILKLRHIFELVFWLWQDVKQIVLFLTTITVSSLKKNLADRFLPSFHLTPALEFPLEDGVPTKPSRVRRRSTLRVQLSSAGSSSTDSHLNPEARAFSFLLDLGLEVDSDPDAQTLHPCQQPLSLPDETTLTLTTCQNPAGGRGEGEARARAGKGQHPAPVQG